MLKLILLLQQVSEHPALEERAIRASHISVRMRPREKMRETGSADVAETSDPVTGEQAESDLNCLLMSMPHPEREEKRKKKKKKIVRNVLI